MRFLPCSLFALLICVAAVAGCSSSSSTSMPHGGPTPNAGPTRCPAADYTMGFGYTDCRANVLRGFDFSQMPRPFTPIKAPYPPSKFTSKANAIPEPPDNE